MVLLTQMEEKSLIALANENRSAFAELYSRYFCRISSYVHYRVADYHAAEDLTNQIFEKLFLKLSYYNPEKAIFSAWLFSIARNTIIDYYRTQSRNDFASIEVTLELVDTELNLDDLIIFHETQQHILKIIALLSQLEQDIIILKFWKGYSNREIAKQLGISESNTGVILFRAIRRLRIILENQDWLK